MTIPMEGLRALSAIAISPAAPICALEDILDDVEMALVMTVNPGFAGQKRIPAPLNKIARLRRMLDEAGHGDVYAAGSSGVLAPGATLEENVRRYRTIIEK